MLLHSATGKPFQQRSRGGDHHGGHQGLPDRRFALIFSPSAPDRRGGSPDDGTGESDLPASTPGEGEDREESAAA